MNHVMATQKKIPQHFHEDFNKGSLDEKQAHSNPFKQFEKWYAQAFDANLFEPNAMTLGTSTKRGKPSSRVVFLRGVEKNGFVFFTNYNSRKGKELKENPYACLLFYWPQLERQVRIEGKIVFAPEKISDTYFSNRPRNSRIGAWASPQSTVLKNRNELEALVSEYTHKYTEEVPRPKNWGGYLLIPSYYEFWQGRPSRLHDRICYTKQKNGKWKKQRLAP